MANGTPQFFTGKKEEWIILKRQTIFPFGFMEPFMTCN
jgi:hypothetical protein